MCDDIWRTGLALRTWRHHGYFGLSVGRLFEGTPMPFAQTGFKEAWSYITESCQGRQRH
jgi:hypothetical protein